MTRAKHRSLDVRTNAVLAIVWFVVCAILTLLFSSARLWAALISGGVVGIGCGRLQDRAIRANPDQLRHAETALTVRRAMVAVRPGAVAIRLQWLFGLALLLLAFSGPPDGFIPVPLAGYFAMMLVRELVSHRSLVWLADHEPSTQPGHD